MQQGYGMPGLGKIAVVDCRLPILGVGAHVRFGVVTWRRGYSVGWVRLCPNAQLCQVSKAVCEGAQQTYHRVP